jgi:type II secretory pathway component GspD/PulD (secretin)
MKIYTITTLITATAVSVFQVNDPAHQAAPVTVSAMPAESASEIRRESGPWELVSVAGDTKGLRVFQNQAGTVADDPLKANEGGFGAGGVVEIVQPTAGATEAVPGTMVDLAEPTPVATVDGVNEVNISTVAPATVAAVEEPEPAEKPEPNAAPDPVATAATEKPEAKTDVAATKVEKAEQTPEQVAPVEVKPAGSEAKPVVSAEMAGVEQGVPPTAVDSLPAFPERAPAEKEGGLADKLVSKVTEAVGGEEKKDENEPTMGEETGGFWLRAAKLNDVFQYLARLGHKQYFHNADLEASNFVVTGHLSEGEPIAQMEELALMYGITIHEKGNTVYAMTSAQLAQLPTKPFYYQLKYLRPSDIEQIKGILQPVLTPGSGTVDYEQKTNTLIFIDNEKRIEEIKEILTELDSPKQQIAIETRILRIKSSSRNRIGVDWESVLGDGMTVEATEALNALFNLPDSDLVERVITSSFTEDKSTGYTVTNRGTENETRILDPLIATQESSKTHDSTHTINSNESHLVLSPLQLQATLRALNSGGLAQQESSPTLITEDNESGIISVIDRIPIITSTISETDAGQNITEDVRYRVDENDPSASEDPSASREIGVTVAVTPTILPDNTIRMSLRPRSAQIVEFIEGRSGNLYPRVNESTVDTIARVPNGYSLLIGGFYEENESEDVKKVPFLGDVPGVNFFFKSSDKIKDHTSLVFVVTPKMYAPVSIPEVDRLNQELHQNHVLPNDHAWPDRKAPGNNYDPHLGWQLGNAVNAFGPTPPSNPLHPEHPVNLPQWDVRDEPGIRQGETMVEPVPVKAERKGLLGNLFKKRQH